MLEAAKADGIRNWKINAAYRSISDQQTLLENRIRNYLKNNSGWSRSRAKSAALRTVAEPGCSEHHLGLGFTAEEWHIRYVGTGHSLAIRDANYCLEEYLDGMPEDAGSFLVEDTEEDLIFGNP